MSILKINTKKLKYRESSGKIYFTSNDLDLFPEWPESDLVELIQGELFMVPSPSIQHQRISSRLEFEMQKFLETNPIGELLHAPVDVELSQEDVIIPDIVFLREQHFSIIQEKRIIGAPDLIIEITSSNKKRDLISKKELYEKYHVNEYIIINPIEKYVLVYQLQENLKYNPGNEYKITDTFQIHTLQNLSIAVMEFGMARRDWVVSLQ